MNKLTKQLPTQINTHLYLRIKINLMAGLILSLLSISVHGQTNQNTEVPLAPKFAKRPNNFQTSHYKYSLEELKDNFSKVTMSLAAEQNKKVKEANDKGKWKPFPQSLDEHQAPEWYKDAKFGMFIDWGPWSVAGWAPKNNGAMYPDWYLKRMYDDTLTRQYNEKNWGTDFQRDDFISLFRAKRYKPEKLVKIAKEAGMKYIVPFCKHHGGFCLWPSSYTQRNAIYLGPKKDLIKPIVDACKKEGLKFGFYFSIEEWAYPLINDNDSLIIREWGGEKTSYSNKYEKELSGKIAVKNFAEDYLIPQATEFIDKYDPDLIWYDGDWSTPAKKLRTYDIASYFYNNAEGRKEVAINDRYGTESDKSLRFIRGDFYTDEYGDKKNEVSETSHAWEECRGISQSFGYNWQDTKKNVISTEAFIKMFVKIVARGGNLLLIVNLDGQGSLPKIEKERLESIGKWLNVNGEGIYSTRPWDIEEDGNNYFTSSKNKEYLYVICLTWPGKILKVKNCSPIAGSNITMLGVNDNLNWEKIGNDIEINIPSQLQDVKNRPCKYAWVMKIQVKENNK